MEFDDYKKIKKILKDTKIIYLEKLITDYEKTNNIDIKKQNIDDEIMLYKENILNLLFITERLKILDIENNEKYFIDKLFEIIIKNFDLKEEIMLLKIIYIIKLNDDKLFEYIIEKVIKIKKENIMKIINWNNNYKLLLECFIENDKINIEKAYKGTKLNKDEEYSKIYNLLKE